MGLTPRNKNEDMWQEGHPLHLLVCTVTSAAVLVVPPRVFCGSMGDLTHVGTLQGLAKAPLLVAVGRLAAVVTQKSFGLV